VGMMKATLAAPAVLREATLDDRDQAPRNEEADRCTNNHREHIHDNATS
jgi:hypothetical protein